MAREIFTFLTSLLNFGEAFYVVAASVVPDSHFDNLGHQCCFGLSDILNKLDLVLVESNHLIIFCRHSVILNESTRSFKICFIARARR